MKKTLVLALAAASLCLALCGCGDYRVEPDNSVKEPDIVSTPSPMLPEISPMITPDVNDGVVKDTDGEIEYIEPEYKLMLDNNVDEFEEIVE